MQATFPTLHPTPIGSMRTALMRAVLVISMLVPPAASADPAMAGKWDVASFQLDGSFAATHAAPLPHKGITFTFLDRPDTLFLITSHPSYRERLLGDLTGKSIVARIGVDVSPGSQFEYFGEPDGSGRGATVRFYFETNASLGEITCPCQDKGNASFWYSSPMAVDLDALVYADVTFTVSLHPSMWADAQERPGDDDPVQAALFAQAVRDVGFIGFSFGGGRHFHNGAGIKAGTGTGSFNVFSYEASPP